MARYERIDPEFAQLMNVIKFAISIAEMLANNAINNFDLVTYTRKMQQELRAIRFFFSPVWDKFELTATMKYLEQLVNQPIRHRNFSSKNPVVEKFFRPKPKEMKSSWSKKVFIENFFGRKLHSSKITFVENYFRRKFSTSKIYFCLKFFRLKGFSTKSIFDKKFR